MSRSRRAEVVEEVEWLLSFGVVPEEIARRLGYSSVKSMMRVINRWGEFQLAQRLYHRQETYIACHKDYEPAGV